VVRLLPTCWHRCGVKVFNEGKRCTHTTKHFVFISETHTVCVCVHVCVRTCFQQRKCSRNRYNAAWPFQGVLSRDHTMPFTAICSTGELNCKVFGPCSNSVVTYFCKLTCSQWLSEFINMLMILLKGIGLQKFFVSDGCGEWRLGHICGLPQQWRCDNY